MMRWMVICFISLLTLSFAVSEDLITYQSIENSPNKAVLDKIDPELLVIYPAEQERYTITVFTDVFCPYCRQLHQNLHQFTDKGITVRFVPFPLTKESNPVLESIWCAPKDQQQFLLDVGMLQMKFKARSCDASIIKDAKAIAKSLNVFGTPSIFLEDGRKVSGFMSPTEIIDGLEGRLNFDEWRPAHMRNQ